MQTSQYITFGFTACVLLVVALLGQVAWLHSRMARAKRQRAAEARLDAAIGEGAGAGHRVASLPTFDAMAYRLPANEPMPARVRANLAPLASPVDRAVTQRLFEVALNKLQDSVEALGFCFAEDDGSHGLPPISLSALQLDQVAREVEVVCRRHQAPGIEPEVLAIWVDNAMRDGSARKFVSELLCALRAYGLSIFLSPEEHTYREAMAAWGAALGEKIVGINPSLR